jgi:hypothetical protein
MNANNDLKNKYFFKSFKVNLKKFIFRYLKNNLKITLEKKIQYWDDNEIVVSLSLDGKVISSHCIKID